jgi:hypothetical protein
MTRVYLVSRYLRLPISVSTDGLYFQGGSFRCQPLAPHFLQ